MPLLPGTYAPESSFTTIIHALADWDPTAVLMGASAAKLTWWPELDPVFVEAATSRALRREVAGLTTSHSEIHPDLIVALGPIRLQNPAASTLELARTLGANAIDEAFRRRATTFLALQRALPLMPGRRGNVALKTYLRDSRDEPWSPFERDAHAILRAAGITGWKANYGVTVRGERMFLDIAFPGPKLDIELDGWTFHGDRASFARDRRRDVLLRGAGWTPLRFTVETLPMMLPSITRLLGK